ncbi:MAG TPA: cytochrome c3 family protein [Candidatus Aquilonibacter sp.]|nr:cytochrome c3 family protein [Candidatus Aquilonibacter sp.]
MNEKGMRFSLRSRVASGAGPTLGNHGEARQAKIKFALFLCGVLFLLFASPLRAQTKNSCLDCHSKLEGAMRVTSESIQSDVHAQKGITCTSCHGGDASSDDKSKSMSPAAGYLGQFDRKQIPELCAKCHSDAAYMRGFNPSLRTDQLSEYHASVHGQMLAKGDDKVAVCIDCHGVHDILPPDDPRSTVYPVNVAPTCGKCHANAEYMKAYNIPTDQLALYNASVHHTELVEKGDLSAPTCTTCHGSHGAAPPGVKSVANVCSTCHVIQGQMYAAGPHKIAFERMGLGSCVTCHTNHQIVHPTDAFIGTGAGAVCLNCHIEGDTGYGPANQMNKELTGLAAAIARSNDILTRAEEAGVEVGDAQLELTEARDDLTKARVEIHTVTLSQIEPDIQAGMQVTQKTWKAGQAALAEGAYRRKGLLFSSAAVLLVLIGLWLKIRDLETIDDSPNTKEEGQ